MAHGFPDWGHDTQQSTVKLVDMGELAKRLGCISTFERGGNIIFADDGNLHLLPYTLDGLQASLVDRSMDGRFVSGSCINLKLYSLGNGTCTITLTIPAAVKGKVGIEFNLAQSDYTLATNRNVYIYGHMHCDGKYLAFQEKVGMYQSALFHGEYLNGVWNYRDITTQFGAYYASFSYGIVRNIKFLFNPVDGYVSYAIFNGKYIDLSGYGSYFTSSNEANDISISIQGECSNLAWYPLIGDIIITDNEAERTTI